MRDEDARYRQERIHRNATTLIGWSDAAYGGQPSLGKCRLGYVIGFMSPNLHGPRHIIHWTSQFARKLVKSRLSGEVYAFSDMLDHGSTLRESYGHFADPYSGMAGLGVARAFLRISKRKS